MGLNITPAFRVVANNQDITDTIRSRFKSLRITGERAFAKAVWEGYRHGRKALTLMFGPLGLLAFLLLRFFY